MARPIGSGSHEIIPVFPLKWTQVENNTTCREH